MSIYVCVYAPYFISDECDHVLDIGYNATLNNTLTVIPPWAAHRILQGSPLSLPLPDRQPIQLRIHGEYPIIFSLIFYVKNVLLVQITPINDAGEEISEKVKIIICGVY